MCGLKAKKTYVLFRKKFVDYVFQLILLVQNTFEQNDIFLPSLPNCLIHSEQYKQDIRATGD